MNKIASIPQDEINFDKPCDELKKPVYSMAKVFLKEYMKAMHPVACGLDILHGEKATGLDIYSQHWWLMRISRMLCWKALQIH